MESTFLIPAEVVPHKKETPTLGRKQGRVLGFHDQAEFPKQDPQMPEDHAERETQDAVLLDASLGLQSLLPSSVLSALGSHRQGFFPPL